MNEEEARQYFLSRKQGLYAAQTSEDKKRKQELENRIAELVKLIQSAYEDKVLGRVPEDVCIELLNKYQAEKKDLQAEYDELQLRSEAERQDEADVDEYIRRVKAYAGATELTRRMCLALIEYVTVDENNKGHRDRPRRIHVYYKFIDKGLTDKHNALA